MCQTNIYICTFMLCAKSNDLNMDKMIESPLWFMGREKVSFKYGQSETISHDKDKVITQEASVCSDLATDRLFIFLCFHSCVKLSKRRPECMERWEKLLIAQPHICYVH